MIRRLSLIPVVAIALLLSGCKTDHEAVAGDIVSKMEELVGVVKSVQDEASSKAAAPKIKAIANDMTELKAKGDKLGKISADDEKKLDAKFKPRIDKIKKDMSDEMERITMNPKLLTTQLQGAMLDLAKAANAMDTVGKK